MHFTEVNEISWLVCPSKMKSERRYDFLYKYIGKISIGNGEQLFKANFGSRTNGSNHCE